MWRCHPPKTGDYHYTSFDPYTPSTTSTGMALPMLVLTLVNRPDDGYLPTVAVRAFSAWVCGEHNGRNANTEREGL